MKYEEARADWEYLWGIGSAQDMTGGYVDQGDLDLMLKSPTKRTATKVFCSQIDYWFQVGPDMSPGKSFPPEHYIATDPRVKEIAIRHGIIFD